MNHKYLRLAAITVAAGVGAFLVNTLASGGVAAVLSPGRLLSLPVAILLGPW